MVHRRRHTDKEEVKGERGQLEEGQLHNEGVVLALKHTEEVQVAITEVPIGEIPSRWSKRLLDLRGSMKVQMGETANHAALCKVKHSLARTCTIQEEDEAFVGQRTSCRDPRGHLDLQPHVDLEASTAEEQGTQVPNLAAE